MRKRVLFICEAVTLAHVARPLVLANELRYTYDVSIAADPSVHHLIQREQWQPLKVTSLSQKEFMSRLKWGKSVFDTKGLCMSVEEDLRLINEICPDVVIGDFRLSLSISSRLSGVPYITLGNAYWLPQQLDLIPVPEMLLTHLCGMRISQWVFDRIAPRVMRSHANVFNSVCKRFGVSSVSNDLGGIYLEGDVTALVDLPRCYPCVSESHKYQFIGPCVWNPPVAKTVEAAEKCVNTTEVFVSLGSSGQLNVLEPVVLGLLQCDCRIFLATAGRPLPQKFNKESNIIIAEFWPGLETAKRSSVIVCNGGSPMTQLAMVCGKPVVGIPSNLDQFLNMAIVEKNGLGIMLRPEGISVDKVVTAMNSIQKNPKYKQLAVEYSKESEAYMKKQRIHDVVKTVVG